jgi:hypothetical protein
MPLKRSDAIANLSDPNIIIGPRKRRPTERVLENGDPLVLKKARNESNLIPSPPTRPTHTMPNPTNHAESSDCGDNTTSDDSQAIVVEDTDDADEGKSDGETVEGEMTDEDDDAELGM